ncbi:MAG: hypothetical protein H0T62_10440 [Parachlamydiaceae bacterium]|nr:hypothetical protein [Parachlamydiaceae bacterium]
MSSIKNNIKLNEINIDIESLLEEDSYYHYHALSLKPASVLKQEHRKQLTEFFEMKQLRLQIENAQNLIITQLPGCVSREIFSTIQQEFDQCADHFSIFIKSIAEAKSHKPILFQEMFGYSDETLLHSYDLASKLVEKKNYDDANDIFVFLTILAPHVSGYWIGQGVCLQALDKHIEALMVFKVAKYLNPNDPFPAAYSIESYTHLRDFTSAHQEEVKSLQEIVNNLTHEEKKQWKKNIKKFTGRPLHK